MKEILDNAEEFLESAEDNIKKKRFNASVSDFFKSIVTFCDYLLYREIKILPKNHNERFSLLKIHFKEIYEKIIELFKKYRESYNIKLTEKDAIKLKDYSYELRNFIQNKN